MEYLDLYDENRKLTGEQILRTQDKPIVPAGKFINVVIIFIRNSKGEFLFQKTSVQKGSVWATTGGHVKSGQTSLEAIKDEVEEELGLKMRDNEFSLFKSYKMEIAFFDVYYLKKDININELKLQEDEVEYVQWLSIEEIKELIANNKLRKGNIQAFLDLIDSL